jgi:hypothetical protein
MISEDETANVVKWIDQYAKQIRGWEKNTLQRSAHPAAVLEAARVRKGADLKRAAAGKMSAWSRPGDKPISSQTKFLNGPA